MRKITIGKEKFTKDGTFRKQLKPFKTERMFKNLDDLKERAEKLKKKYKEVIINENLVTIQYR